MVAVSSDLEMKRLVIDKFLDKAIELEPKLIEKNIRPKKIVEVLDDANVRDKADINSMKNIHLKNGDSIVLDFGDHQVGYISISLKTVGSPQDAPAYLRLKFGEVAKEIIEDSRDYDGWISRGWIQEEFIHLDVLPTTINLPRRYAFRFLEIYAIDTSMKFQVVVEDVV